MIVRWNNTENVRELFGDWKETMIWSCLQGIMGDIYAEDISKPRSAMAVIGDFCFCAGEPAEMLLSYLKEQCGRGFVILIPQCEGWERLIERCYGEQAQRITRYAIKKEGHVFDRMRLKEAVRSLPDGFELKIIDEMLYHACSANKWSRDLVSQYVDYKTYHRLGLGVAVVRGQELVAGASSYTSYRGGIEIEIDTKEEYRRKGLAYAAGAGLILECMDRGLYPSWDAENLWSVGLAEKLGYHFDYEYPAYRCFFDTCGCQHTEDDIQMSC